MRREIKHDPESGCDACPFLRTWGDRDEPTRWCMGGECDAAGSGDPAPGWCPLRAGDVIVSCEGTDARRLAALDDERRILGIPERDWTREERATIDAARRYLAEHPGPMERAVLDLLGIEGRKP